MSKISVLVCAVFMACCIASSKSRPHGGGWGGYPQSNKGNWGGYHHGFRDFNQNTHRYHGDGDFSPHSGEVYHTQYKRPFERPWPHWPHWHTDNGECDYNSFEYNQSGDEDVNNTNKTDEHITNNVGGENINPGKTPNEAVNSNSGGENIDIGNASDEDIKSIAGGENIDTVKTPNAVINSNSGSESIDTMGVNINNNTGGETIDAPKAEATTVRDSNVEDTGLGETTEYPFKLDIRYGFSNDNK